MTGETHSVYDMKFRRKFSINPYKNLRMKLGEMSFFKDWLHTDRGDPYPVITETPAAELTETTGDGRYSFANPSGETAAQSRLLGQHFPYASYEVMLRSMKDCGVGFLFRANAEGRSSYTKEDEPELRIFLQQAKTAGLDAMEVYYSLIDEAQTELACRLTEEYGLLKSGGSDFHGSNKPDIRMGTGKGNLRIPLTLLEAMENRIS